jgi:glycosyltransferase involved in cell wall biosynthesis
MKVREMFLGYSLQEKIVDGCDNTLLGLNPDIEHSRVPNGYADLKSCLAHHRLYLNTTVDPYEDGYNLAMLEAMAAGMPIVSTANATSPITDGVEGFISSDIDCLRALIAELIADRALARELGANAKRKVEEAFSLEKFKTAWNEAFEEAVSIRNHGAKRANRKAAET